MVIPFWRMVLTGDKVLAMRRWEWGSFTAITVIVIECHANYSSSPETRNMVTAIFYKQYWKRTHNLSPYAWYNRSHSCFLTGGPEFDSRHWDQL